MTLIEKSSPEPIHPYMTLLEVMFQWRASEAVFQAYEAQAGTCLRCHALFDTLEEAARKYNLNLNQLVADLNALALSPDANQEKQP
jgi:4-alpha-glucanotransferase